MCAQKAKVQRTQKQKKVVAINADAILAKTPAKLGDQDTSDHFIKIADEGEDVGIPINMVAVVMLARAAQWIAICPKA